jgi:3-hydroxypropanoate dehydrogenase
VASEIDQQAMQQVFIDARSHSYWQDKPVSEEQIRRLYDLTKMGPTSANSCPARFVFVTSDQAKARLKDCLNEGNVEKSMSAPAVAIIAMDMEFYEQLPKLYPHTDARSWYAGKDDKIFDAAFRNSSLQGAYLIMAIRSLGMDAGPMSGFDSAKLDATFFPDGKVKSNFICAFGYGNHSKLYPRGPRLEFDEACSIL